MLRASKRPSNSLLIICGFYPSRRLRTQAMPSAGLFSHSLLADARPKKEASSLKSCRRRIRRIAQWLFQNGSKDSLARLSTPPQHHWVTKLFGYDFTVEFRLGSLNMVADALSRRHDNDAAAHAISGPSFELFDELRREVQEIPDLRALRDTGVA